VHEGLTEDGYREKWGYNRTTPLMCREERTKVEKEARRRHWGSRPAMEKARLAKRGQTSSGSPGPMRPEERLNRSKRQRGKAQPKMLGRGNPEFMKRKRKPVPPGWVVSDVRIAELRYQGHTLEEIAAITNLSIGSVSVRLLHMGFGGRDIAFDRGAVVTGQQIVNLCEDFNLTRAELSASVGKGYDWASGRTGPENVARPLSRKMARELLALRDGLRDEYRQTAPTAEGGRPRLLLPSEPAELRERYPSLLGDLQELKGFLLKGPEPAKEAVWKPTMKAVWDWLCQQRRLGKMRTLFYWRQFFSWIQEAEDAGTAEKMLLWAAWKPWEMAVDFVAHEYGVGAETVTRIVQAAPRTQE
jgi:hypothetical protein